MTTIIRLVLCALLCAGAAECGLVGSISWDVRTTGSDVNGGGFDAANGTADCGNGGSCDYSQRDTAAFSGSDLVADANHASNRKVTSASHAFNGADVGNLVNITGTGAWTAGRYLITSVSSGAAVLDRVAAANAAGGGGWYEGGSLATIQAALNYCASGPLTVYVKAGTYNLTAGLSPAGCDSDVNHAANHLVGYSSAHADMPAGDARPRIATNGHAIVAFTGQGSWILENLIFDGAGSPRGAAGVNLNFGRNTVYNVKVTNFAGNGFTGGADASTVLWSESGNNGGTGIAIGGQALVAYSWVHDNAGKGIQFSANLGTAVRNLVTNNGTTGIDLFYSGVSLENTLYGNGDAGVRASSNGVVANSLFVRNANGGVRDSWAPLLGGHNGFYGNTYGTYTIGLTDLGVYPSDVSAPGAWNAVNSPFAHDVTAGPGDWTLKAGSVFRSAGLPGAMPGNVPNNLFDIGAYQSRTSGTSGGERSCTFVR